MKALLILNEPPYGNERTYNGLRLAHALLKQDYECEVTVFPMADAVWAAKAAQQMPDSSYNIERMLRPVCSQARGRLLLCASCMDARGLSENEGVEGAERSTMAKLAKGTAEADRTLACRNAPHVRARADGATQGRMPIPPWRRLRARKVGRQTTGVSP